MTRCRRSRTPASLSDSLHRQLTMYALAAGAAGVGALALAQPSEARVVYTPANVTIVSQYALDLNNDGKFDFLLTRGLTDSGSYQVSYMGVCLFRGTRHCYPATTSIKSNAVRVVKSGWAAALRAGAVVQRSENFKVPTASVSLGRRSYNRFNTSSQQKWFGPWMNGGHGVRNRYLGFKFKIQGKFHFGWARITVTTTPKNGFTEVLTGYAYETIPGKSIIAGKTHGPENDWEDDDSGPGASVTRPVPDSRQPASLGALAMGAPALSIWRRKESVGAAQ